jgi:hypothetical protein
MAAAAMVSACAAAAARSRWSGSVSSYSRIRKVQTRLSKSRLDRLYAVMNEGKEPDLGD